VAIHFDTDFEPRHGELVDVSPLLRRIVCPNESKYTFRGTGTYVVGRGDVAIVDPGPADDSHLTALLHGLRGETVSHVLITHTHLDHSPGARRIAAETGAVVLGFGPHPPDARTEGDSNPSEHAHSDVDFRPDQPISHGDVVSGRGWTVEAIHTPGHISNHLCFALHEEDAVLSGDHVMGWSTTVIPPPDGNIGDYLRSLRVLLDRDDSVLYPTHGPPIRNPRTHVSALLQHRLDRELQIVEQLELGPRSAVEIVATLYADVRTELHKPAAHSVIAHLHHLRDQDHCEVVHGADPLSSDTLWAISR